MNTNQITPDPRGLALANQIQESILACLGAAPQTRAEQQEAIARAVRGHLEEYTGPWIEHVSVEFEATPAEARVVVKLTAITQMGSRLLADLNIVPRMAPDLCITVDPA